MAPLLDEKIANGWEEFDDVSVGIDHRVIETGADIARRSIGHGSLQG